MSLAQASRTVKFISKSGSYTSMITCDYGDLILEYTDTGSTKTVIPDLTKVKPILTLNIISSRAAEGLVVPDSTDFYLGSTKLTFDGNNKSNNAGMVGYFLRISATQLQILGDVAAAVGYASTHIRMVSRVSSGTMTDEIQAQYPILIQPSTGSAVRVTIAPGDANNFVIKEKGTGQCVLKAMTYKEGVVYAPTTGLTYKWEKMGASGWTVLSGKTAQTLTVKEADVDTYGDFRVTVSEGGVELGKDVQGVMDSSDPYIIEARPDPEDETIVQGSGGKISYNPILVKRGDASQTPVAGVKFKFLVLQPSGVVAYQTSGASETLPFVKINEAMITQENGDLSVNITAEI